MKKTIIALCALVGMAAGEDPYSWDPTEAYCYEWDFNSATLGGTLTNSGYLVEDDGTTLARGSGTHQYWETGTNSFFYDALTAVTSTNATLTFTMDYWYVNSNWGQTIMHIGQDGKGISLGVAPGGYLSVCTGTASDTKFTECQSTTQLTAAAWNQITFTLSNNQWTTKLDGVTSSAQPLGDISWPTDVTEINKYSIGNKAPGYNTGVNGIKDSGCKISNLTVSYAPEPATAALSLLALAGLATRRRRR